MLKVQPPNAEMLTGGLSRKWMDPNTLTSSMDKFIDGFITGGLEGGCRN